MEQTLELSRPSAQQESNERRKWWVLVAMVFGLFMPMLDNLVVNVALPTIQHKLGAGVSGLQWIIDAYTLTFASFMLTGGALGDLYGRKRFFMSGLAVFALRSRRKRSNSCPRAPPQLMDRRRPKHVNAGIAGSVSCRRARKAKRFRGSGQNQARGKRARKREFPEFTARAA